MLTSGCLASAAGQPRHRLPVVIDTDVGLDDAVALAAALQQRELKIRALIVSEGVASAAAGLKLASRLLVHFKRDEIPLYRPASKGRPAPPFRLSSERELDAGLPRPDREVSARQFSHAAYGKQARIVVLALGPLTNLAAALKRDPALVRRIAVVIFRGAPRAADSWNVRFDTAAHRAVVAAGIPLAYIRSGKATAKSAPWLDRIVRAPRSPAARMLARLARPPGVKKHYLDELPSFTDELALAYLLHPALFERRPIKGTRTATVHARARQPLLDGLARLLLQRR